MNIDDFTVHIKTAAPFPLMANDVSNIAIVSSETGCNASTEDCNNGPASAGTGPFKFVSYSPGDSIVLERNEDYWGEKPTWTKVTMKQIKSGPSRVAVLLAGDVDMIEGVPTTDITTLAKKDDLALSQGVSNRVIYLHLDHARSNSPLVKANGGGEIDNLSLPL